MRVGWKAATSDKAIASFRYRALAPIAALRARGHDVELATPDRMDTYDAVVFSKSYRKADQQVAHALKAKGKQVFFDICDNHFYNPYNLASYRSARDELVDMIGLADQVICSTPELARVLQAESGATRVCVVGDAAEFVELPRAGEKAARKSLLWFGSHGSPNAPCGMNDLLAIEPVLRKISRDHDFKVVVASNNRQKFESLTAYFDTPMEYVEWTLDGFPALLAQAEAVVIPLSRNPFVNSKTHNRLTTALGAGVPVIADSIESYREFAEFCVLDNWETGLKEALGDPRRARERAAPARAYLEKHWSMDRLTVQWESALGLAHLNGHGQGAVVTADIATTNGVDLPGVYANGTNGNGHGRATRRYQGAVDPEHGTTITGWVMLPLDSQRLLEVVLKIDGVAVARDIAQRRRGDLEASGFRKSDCGFSLKVPAEYCDDEEHEFMLVADDQWVIETGTRRFREFRAANLPRVRIQSQDVAARPAAEMVDTWDDLKADQIGDSLALATDALASNAAELASVALQKKLFADLEQLNAAVDAVRRIAARMILTAADHGEPPVEQPQRPRLNIASNHERHTNGDTPPPRSSLS